MEQEIFQEWVIKRLLLLGIGVLVEGIAIILILIK